jgi:hypothetical protein
MKMRHWSFVSGLMVLLFAAGWGLLFPPRVEAASYKISKIWPYSGYTPKINNAGQVVWDWEDMVQRLVYLYSQGQVAPLSPDPPAMLPEINDKGEVTWQKNYSGQGNEVYLYSGSQIIPLSDQNNPQIPKINNNSQVLWAADGNGMMRTRLFVYSHSDQTITPITGGDDIDFGHEFNDKAEVTWSRSLNIDLGTNVICLYRDSKITEISPRGHFDQTLKINNRTQVLYRGTHENEKNLYLYDHATTETTPITTTADVYGGYDLNDQGQVVFCVDEGGYVQNIYLYDNGETTKLSVDPQFFNNRSPRINNRGQVVWVGGGHIFLYDAGQVKQVTSGATSSFGSPNLNERGEIVFTGYDQVLGGGTFLAAPGILPPISILLLN